MSDPGDDEMVPTTRVLPTIRSPILDVYTRQLEDEVRSLRRDRAVWMWLFWTMAVLAVAMGGVAFCALARGST